MRNAKVLRHQAVQTAKRNDRSQTANDANRREWEQGWELRVGSCGLWVVGWELWVAGCGLGVVGCGLWVGSCGLFGVLARRALAHNAQRTTRNPQPIFHPKSNSPFASIRVIRGSTLCPLRGAMPHSAAPVFSKLANARPPLADRRMFDVRCSMFNVQCSMFNRPPKILKKQGLPLGTASLPFRTNRLLLSHDRT
jgi:hypothetical protein